MKNLSAMLFLVLFIILLLSGTTNGQNVVLNSSFEDDSVWEYYNGGTPDDVEFVFPYSDDMPTFGSGSACCYVYGYLTTGEWINGLIWQEVELQGGTTYVLDAAWLHLGGPIDAGTWFQIYVSEEEPVDGADWAPAEGTHSARMFSFNSWSGCSGIDLDVTFMDYACEDNHTALIRAPAEAGQTVPVFIGFKAGAGWGGTEFELAVDDITLRPNLIVNGDFEDESGWTVWGQGAPNDLEVVLSDDSGNNPNLGHNKCLYLKGNANGESCNGLVWQQIELAGGKSYGFNAGFRHLSGNLGDGSWVQAYISEEAPVEGVDWTPAGGSNSEVLIGFNSWSGCSGDTIDGTFRRYGCDGKNTTIYTAPGTPGEPVTLYFGIKAGCGWGGETLEVTIDDVSLVELADSGTRVENESSGTPYEFVLCQNYPNPFNPSTIITYTIAKSGNVRLTVYDVLGREIESLVNRIQQPGQYTVQWSPEGLANGVYVYKLESGGFVDVKKLLYIK